MDVKRHLEEFLTIAQPCFSSAYIDQSTTYRSRPVLQQQPTPKLWQKSSARDFTASAFAVLHCVPIARDAVLEYLSAVVQESVKCFISQLENPNITLDMPNLEEAAVMITDKLKELVNIQPQIWVALAFKWSTETLSQITASNYGRSVVPDFSKLNELVQLYTSCKASKCVLDVARDTLGHLLESEPEKCVNAVLDLSTKYGRNFDWILTSIGTWYPKAMVGRLLDCAKTEYATHMTELTAKQHSLTITQANQRQEEFGARFSFHVAIITHLSQHQRANIVEALREIAKDSISSVDAKANSSTMGIPFLFKLMSMSVHLLNIIIAGLSDLITVENLNVAARLMLQIPKQFLVDPGRGDLSSLLHKMVLTLPHSTLCLVIDKLIELAFSSATPAKPTDKPSSAVQRHAKDFLDSVLTSMQNQVHNQASFTEEDLPLLQELGRQLPRVLCELYADNKDKSKFYFRLMCLVCWMHGAPKTTDLLTSILVSAKNEQQLSLFASFCCVLLPYHPTALDVLFAQFPSGLRLTLQSLQTSSHFDGENFVREGSPRWLQNLLTLLKWSQKGFARTSTDARHKSSPYKQFATDSDSLNLLSNISACILQNYAIVCPALLTEARNDVFAALRVFDILLAVGAPVPQLPSTVMRIATSLVELFFAGLQWKDTNERMDFYWKYQECLQNFIGQQQIAREFVFRFLIQGAFDKHQDVFLKPADDHGRPETSKNAEEFSLLLRNRAMTERQAASIIHSGIIGGGLRKLAVEGDAGDLPDDARMNRLLFVHLMESLILPASAMQLASGVKSSPQKTGGVGQQAAALTASSVADTTFYRSAFLCATLLTDVFCSDGVTALYGWDSWENTKCHLSSFLTVARRLEQKPLVWSLLPIICEAYPCAWYCLPLFKCVLVSLLSHCEGTADKNDRLTPRFCESLDRLLAVLQQVDFMLGLAFVSGNGKAKMLPAPFVWLSAVAREVTVFEIYRILLDVWLYFADATPTMADRFSRGQLQAAEMNESAIFQKPALVYLQTLRLVMTNNIATLGCLFTQLFGTDEDLPEQEVMPPAVLQISDDAANSLLEI